MAPTQRAFSLSVAQDGEVTYVSLTTRDGDHRSGGTETTHPAVKAVLDAKYMDEWVQDMLVQVIEYL